jgi:hypothetical protein
MPEKNSRRNDVFGVLLSVPEMLTKPAETGADVIVG